MKLWIILRPGPHGIKYFPYLNLDHEDFEEDEGDVVDDEVEEEEEEEEEEEVEDELLDEEAQLMASMGLPVAFASHSVKKKTVRDRRGSFHITVLITHS